MKMRQEVSVSYQAVKSRVYRLIDSFLEDGKTSNEVKGSLKRWWDTIEPNDRPIARKYLLAVLRKSNSGMEAICEGISDLEDFHCPATSWLVLSRLPELRLKCPDSRSPS
jgi:hypothetical protein